MSEKLGTITLWINSFKKEDNHPDFKGRADIDGRKVDVVLWINRDLGGVPLHMSGQISEPYEGQGQPEDTREPKYGGKNPTLDPEEDGPF